MVFGGELIYVLSHTYFKSLRIQIFFNNFSFTVLLVNDREKPDAVCGKKSERIFIYVFDSSHA